jgi:hypothetical protein
MNGFVVLARMTVALRRHEDLCVLNSEGSSIHRVSDSLRNAKGPARGAGLFACVPSMNDSLEVEVLYPA